MPVGIITDASATLCGALLGCVLNSRLGDSWKKLLNNLLGVAALFMGIVLIIRAKNLAYDSRQELDTDVENHDLCFLLLHIKDVLDSGPPFRYDSTIKISGIIRNNGR